MPQSTSFTVTPWISCYKPRPDALLRLFCFPHGGGGPQAFKSWADNLPKEIEVYCLNLPGRFSRRNDPPIHNMPELSDQIVHALSAYLDKPFALFGHSVGALVAYEVTRGLEEKGSPLPVRLLVSAHKVPHDALEEEPMYNLPDQELVQKIIDLGLVPAEVLENKELIDFILPPLKADFEVSETYKYTERNPLPVAITAMGGEGDTLLSPEDLDAWKEYSSLSFQSFLYKGDHFYTETLQKEVLKDISQWLLQDLKDMPKAIKDGPTADYPEKCLHEIFREQAAAHPDRIAIADPGGSLTFRDLDEKTDLVARYLQKQGVRVDSIGGICMDSCVEYVIAYLAILKAGGAYMPIELAYPPAFRMAR
jgi:surfactin synthase thioesterase subunit